MQAEALSNGRRRIDARSIRTGDFELVANSAYFTCDPLAVDTLLASVDLKGPILEPAAGRGDIVVALRGKGYQVEGRDLHGYADPLVDDIVVGADALEIETLAGFGAVVSNLPYGAERGKKPLQDRILEHLLPIAARDGAVVAVLVEMTWVAAASADRGRLELVHRNLRFAGLIFPPDRLIWFGKGGGTQNHAWAIFTPTPRAEGERPFLDFVTRDRLPNFQTKKARKAAIDALTGA